MNEAERETRRQRIAVLRAEHRELDDAIAGFTDDPFADHLQLKRMKIRKLKLKDTIARLESALIPDWDA